MRIESLTSLDVHLRHPAAQVIETACLRDVGCGVHPCYHRKTPAGLKVAASAAALVIDSGEFVRNPRFRPHDFLAGRTRWQTALRDLPLRLPRELRRRFRAAAPGAVVARLRKARFCYETWETIDARVHRLRPCETIDADGFGGKRLFWSGTLSTAHFCMHNHYEDDRRFRGEARAAYFNSYFTRTACPADAAGTRQG